MIQSGEGMEVMEEVTVGGAQYTNWGTGPR